jgi:hypothetical protein
MIRFPHVTQALAALLFPGAVLAQSDAAPVESLPTSGMLSIEKLRLPGGEHLGLVGGSLLFDIGSDWGIGPAVYGGATGHRGGFFVGGVELQRRWALTRGLSLATGIYLGGGGGAAAPVGSGLMLRPAVTLLKDIGPALQAGLSWSSVRFPSGQIASNQIGLTLAWRSEFVHLTNPTDSPAPWLSQASGIGFDRMAVTAASYRFSDDSGRRISLAGARAERRSDLNGFTWGLEAAAAAQGNASGYMELLGTAQFSTALMPSLAPSWRVGARLGGGLAGGGSVPTGGGVIAKAAATMEVRIAPGWTVGGEYGLVRAVNGDLRARQAQAWLAIDLEPGLDGRSTPTSHVVRTEWVGVLQHHNAVQRNDGSRRSLDTIGLKLNRYLTDHVYVSGQAHSAFAGGAGAYSVGLIGAGLVTQADAPLRAGVEALIGASGGGGVQSAGGAIAQGVVWGGWSPSPKSEWRLGAGATRGFHAGRQSPVIELSWSRKFGMPSV